MGSHRRLVVTALVSGGAALLGGACSGQTLPAGGVMVAFATDVSVPKDVDSLAVIVSQNGVVRFQQAYPVGPTPAQTLPATLLILPPKEDPSSPVQIRVVALQSDSPRILRDAILVVPTSRVAELRMPVEWLCEGSAGAGPSSSAGSTYVPTLCTTSGQTCSSGSCVDASVDPATLPPYDPVDVFGGGNGAASGGGSCFDTISCFAAGQVAAVDEASCTIAAPDGGTGVDVAILVAAGGGGICGPEACLVPLDESTTDGWQATGSVLQLPPAVCTKLKSGEAAGVVTSTACASKTPSIPTCGAWSSVAGGIPDAGQAIALDATAPPADATTADATAVDATTSDGGNEADGGESSDAESAPDTASLGDGGCAGPGSCATVIPVTTSPLDDAGVTLFVCPDAASAGSSPPQCLFEVDFSAATFSGSCTGASCTESGTIPMRVQDLPVSILSGTTTISGSVYLGAGSCEGPLPSATFLSVPVSVTLPAGSSSAPFCQLATPSSVTVGISDSDVGLCSSCVGPLCGSLEGEVLGQVGALLTSEAVQIVSNAFASDQCLALGGGTPIDAGSSDASAPAGDAATTDSGATCGMGPTGTSCTPQPLTCTPAGVPAKTSPGGCTGAQVTTYYNDCINAASSPVCDASEIGATCYACLVSQSTDSSWGPLIVYGQVYAINLGACYQIEGASASCALATQEQSECEAAACFGACASSSATQLNDCTSSADTGECATYVSAALNCAPLAIQNECEEGDSGTATFQSAFLATARIFCE